MNRHPAGVVLTGGASRRMGSDKAFVDLDGRPMVIAVADALREGGCQPVGCQGGDVERLATLGLEATADSAPGDGPVAAIADALVRIDAPIVVAACDLGYLDGATVRRVIAAGADAGRSAVATADGFVHLLSYWVPAARSGVCVDEPLSYRDALAAVDAVHVAVDRGAVRNLNRPDDL